MTRRFLPWVFAVLFLALIATETWRVLTPTAAVSRGPVVIEIPAHDGLTGIARRLRDGGVIRSRAGFVALSIVRGSARALKAGEYEIPQGAGTPSVLGLLESGRVRQHTVLHPEGATVAELARVLEAERLATAADVIRVAHDPAFLKSHGIEGPSAEGYLFPDTYQFVRGMRTDEMLGRMVQRLHAKLTPDVLARAKELGLTPHQLLTLGSIIEREAVDRSELSLISAVFWNRLRRDMPLQADPTVQYGLRKERRTLTRADLAADDPFNTYRRHGLPPGPIASPGIPAIEAALHPAAVNYLYFVARDDRRHYFSTTVQEHNAAVARYRLVKAR